MLNRPSSRLVDQMEYYIAPVDEETDFLKISSPEELTIIDPACGSGHMLTYAFDLLYAIYEEEGYAPVRHPRPDPDQQPVRDRDRPARRGARGLRADHEGSGTQRTFFNKQVKPNVCVLEPIRFTPEEIELPAYRPWRPPRRGRLLESVRACRHVRFADPAGPRADCSPLDSHRSRLTTGGRFTPSPMSSIGPSESSSRPRLWPRATTSSSPTRPTWEQEHGRPAQRRSRKRVPGCQRPTSMRMFIDRELSSRDSRAWLTSMITMQSWMFLSSLRGAARENRHGSAGVEPWPIWRRALAGDRRRGCCVRAAVVSRVLTTDIADCRGLRSSGRRSPDEASKEPLVEAGTRLDCQVSVRRFAA